MGLRINHNLASLGSLRNLYLHTRALSKLSEQISSGKRINHAKDDPAGTVQSALLRVQINEQQASSEAITFGINLLDAADSGFEQMQNQLLEIRTQIVAAQSQPDVSTNQIVIDQAIDSIESLANATSFNGIKLLNGASGFAVTAFTSGQLTDVRPYRASFATGASDRTFTVTVTTKAARAGVNEAAANRIEQGENVSDGSAGLLTLNAAFAADTTFNITGPSGSASITTTGAPTQGEIRDAVNDVRSITGVYAANNGANVQLISDTYGSTQRITVTNVEGASVAFTNGGETTTLEAGESTTNKGRDAVGTVDGVAFGADGLNARVSSPNLVADIQLAADLATNVATTFRLNAGGIKLAVGPGPSGLSQINIGLPAFLSGRLGNVTETIPATAPPSAPLTTGGGVLSTLKSGGANALTASSGLSDQLRIVDQALSDLNRARSIFGSISAQQLQPNKDVLDGLVVTHTDELARVEDLDFGEATARQAVVSALLNSSLASLVTANQIPGRALALLGLTA